MNARLLLVRAAPAAALSLTLSALLGAGTVEAQAARQPAQPQPDQGAVAEAVEATAPITQFDLAKAINSESGGLTADEAAKKARARAPQIASARAGATAAEEEANSAWDQFLPQLNFAAQYKRVKYIENRLSFGQPDYMTASGEPVVYADTPNNQMLLDAAQDPSAFTQPRNQYAVTGNARWAVSDVFLRAWPAYKASVTSAEAQKTQTEVSESVVSLNARNAFYDYARAVAQLAVDEQALKQAEAQAEQIKLFVEAGTSAKVDYLTAAARVEESRSTVLNSQARLTIAQNTLAVLTGMNPEDVKGIAEPVLEAPEGPRAQTDELIKRALEQRAELRALRKLARAGDYSHTAAQFSGLPQIVLSANGLSGQPNPRYIPINKDKFRNSWEVGVALEWSPNATLASVRNARRTDAQLQKARADLLAQEDAVRTEVVTAYQNYKASEAVSAASQARLAAAEEAYRVRLATYRVGAGVIVDLLNADLEVTRARLALANAAINTRAALATLNRVAALDR